MADWIEVLPNFDTTPWRHLTYSLEKKGYTVAQLLTLDPVEIGRKCPLPPREVKRMAAAMREALLLDVGMKCNTMPPPPRPHVADGQPARKRMRFEARSLDELKPEFVRTLDPLIDECLGGGFPTGRISEIVGESAVGKTQLVLSLLLSAQLPAPHGLGRSVLYVFTEERLNTVRIEQMIKSHPHYENLPEDERPSMDRIVALHCPNYEFQERVLNYGLEGIVQTRNIGLIVIDSIAAHFRAEYQGASAKVLTLRAIETARLGGNLRKLALKYDVAIVITNQVADRFDDAKTIADKVRMSSSALSSSASRSQSATQKPAAQTANPSTQPSRTPAQATRFVPPTPGPLSQADQAKKDSLLNLDFQQRFFTGWGDEPDKPFDKLKTPALGLTWANQLHARVVLKISEDTKVIATDNLYSDRKRNRFLSVVFAGWVHPTVWPVQYELRTQGLVALPRTVEKSNIADEDWDDEREGLEADIHGLDGAADEEDEVAELLDPKYWTDDEEFL